MEIRPYSTIVCPIDQTPLRAEGSSLRCEKNHSFDRAREGYTNLLAVQWKGSKNPGDDADMVTARTRFLSAGLYAPIAERVVAELRPLFDSEEPARVADAGCGEGYYLRTIAALAGGGKAPLLELGGYDISKPAVRAAAKQGGPIAYFVAGHRHPPFAAGSVDALLSIFGFADWASFAGLLSEDGRVITVDSGPDHLRELREIVYPEVKETKAARFEEQAEAGFTLEAEDSLRFSFTVPSAALLADLLSMTPHGHRAPAERKKLLLERSSLALTGEVVLRRWRHG